MEALLVEQLPDEPGWLFEPKWDGFRCLAVRDGDDVTLWSRSGKPLTRYFPEVVPRIEDMECPRFTLDGELVVPTPTGLSFDALSQRLHPAESRIRKLAAETPAILMAFDMLDELGVDLRQSTLHQRRARSRCCAPASRASISLRRQRIDR